MPSSLVRVKTPVVEHFEALAKKAGQEVINKIYYFKDMAGRDLGLRFDMTVPASCSPTKHAEAR